MAISDLAMAALMHDGYSVAVRGRMMCAHSFKGERFGPARALHGCTYVVDAVCKGSRLLPGANYLVDICAAEAALHAALSLYDQRNLDDISEFEGDNTTCERLARAVWERVAAALSTSQPAVEALQIIVKESDVAYVEYERRLGANAPPGLYSVSVRARFMAARSLRGARFGDAQRLHGGTFIVDALFSGRDLVSDATFLIDICLAEELLQKAVAPLHQCTIDDHATLSACGRRNATGGAIAQALWSAVSAGLPAQSGIERLKVRVSEHDEAIAEYVRDLHVPRGMHTLVARGRCMIAHSFRGEEFGPAQALHGCTYVIDGRFHAADLAPDDGFVCERAAAERALREAIGLYHQRNLDELAEFAAENTTCERVARAVWARAANALTPAQRRELNALELVVHESDVAWVSFGRALGEPGPRCGAVLLLDVDSLAAADAAAVADAASSQEQSADHGPTSSTPTGIVHRTPLGTLASVVPHRLVAVSRQPAAAASALLARMGVGTSSHSIRLVAPPEETAEVQLAELAEALGGATAKEAGRPLFLLRGAAHSSADSLLTLLPYDADPVITTLAVGPGCAADRALLATLGCTSPRVDDASSRVAYLTAKRPIDALAYSADVVQALVVALTDARKARMSIRALRVFDLGAGTLSMLAAVRNAAAQAGWSKLDYFAFDADRALLDAAAIQLTSAGGQVSGSENASAALLTAHDIDMPASRDAPATRVALYVADVLELESLVAGADHDWFAPCDLVVGSGFADLLPPVQLASLLTRLSPGGLAYLPITFAGATRLEPPSDGNGTIPSDAFVMEAYHTHLRTQGQYLEPANLTMAVSAVGGELLSGGASHWHVPADAPLHSWMVDFLAGGTARAMWAEGYDPAAWRAAVIKRRATVVAQNIDLLLRLPAPADDLTMASTASYSAVEFAAPRSVVVVQKALPADGVSAGSVVIRSVVSMISSGTELLVYRGQLDESDEPLDKNIKGLSDAGLQYPMSYGYSLVGRIASVGPGVSSRLLGELVFAFAPHAQYAFAEAGGIQQVPKGISAADAAFLPAAETAISIVHDAHPRLGETVHVFGAGVIGLLVIACLSAAGSRVVAVEPDEPRRRLALLLGASDAVQPSDTPRKAADVSIECSGAPAALQGAIDSTADCGRVVVASWYGAKQVNLRLGTAFHRSHIEMIASQVSEVTGPHARRWSKARRFEAAWELIRRVRPATRIPVLTSPLERAADAYALLDTAKSAPVVHLVYGEQRADNGAVEGVGPRARI